MSAAAVVPIVIVDDLATSADNLRDELVERLREWRPDIRVCYDVAEIDENISGFDHPEMVFILDIDMGPGRELAGLHTIRMVSDLRNSKKLPYYIVVLTSHGELEREAYDAGADVFLTKATSHTIDALEVVTRLEWRRAERIQKIARENQRELAKSEYQQLLRRLRQLIAGDMRYIAESLASISRALNWPFIPAEHSMVLSMLRGPFMKAEQSGFVAPEMVEMAIEGIGLLRTEPPNKEALAGWVSRMDEMCPNSVVRWLSVDDPAIMDDWELPGSSDENAPPSTDANGTSVAGAQAETPKKTLGA
jgi:CheY-like chemotaxis protein